LAEKGHQDVMSAVVAAGVRKSVGKDAAFRVLLEGLAHEGPGAVVVALAVELTCVVRLKPGPVMLGHCLVAQCTFGVARVVALGLAGGVHECFVNKQNSADFPSAGLRSKTTPKGRYMPAVYEGDEKGNEALMNTNVIDGNS
jgi:hypothetical protein